MAENTRFRPCMSKPLNCVNNPISYKMITKQIEATDRLFHLLAYCLLVIVIQLIFVRHLLHICASASAPLNKKMKKMD